MTFTTERFHLTLYPINCNVRKKPYYLQLSAYNMLLNSGAALNRNSVYLLIGYLLFQYCMQIRLLMLGYTAGWPMLFLGGFVVARGAQSETTVNNVWVYINGRGKLAQPSRPLFLGSILMLQN